VRAYVCVYIYIYIYIYISLFLYIVVYLLLYVVRCLDGVRQCVFLFLFWFFLWSDVNVVVTCCPTVCDVLFACYFLPSRGPPSCGECVVCTNGCVGVLNILANYDFLFTSPARTAEVQIAWSVTSTSRYVFMAWCLSTEMSLIWIYTIWKKNRKLVTSQYEKTNGKVDSVRIIPVLASVYKVYIYYLAFQ
jgi:hypothetical protein